MPVRELDIVERIPAEIIKADQFSQQCRDDLQIFRSSDVELLVCPGKKKKIKKKKRRSEHHLSFESEVRASFLPQNVGVLASSLTKCRSAHWRLEPS